MNKNRTSHKTRTKTLASGSPPGCEETLDPDNWEEMRGLGHRMVDEMLAFLKNIRERPAWQRVPDEVREHLAVPLPLEPQGAESAYRDFKKDVLPYSIGIHPRFFDLMYLMYSRPGRCADELTRIMHDLPGQRHQPTLFKAESTFGRLLM